MVSVRTFSVMYDHTLFWCLQITKSDIRLRMKWIFHLAIPNSHVNHPKGFVWVCMGEHTHLITLAIDGCTLSSLSHTAHLSVHTLSLSLSTPPLTPPPSPPHPTPQPLTPITLYCSSRPGACIFYDLELPLMNLLTIDNTALTA